MDTGPGDRAPHVRRADDGTDWWWVGGQRTNSFAGGSQAGRRFVDADALVLADAIDNVREDVWTPRRYVRENPSEGRNLIITQVKRRGFGYRNFANYRLRVLHRCA